MTIHQPSAALQAHSYWPDMQKLFEPVTIEGLIQFRDQYEGCRLELPQSSQTFLALIDQEIADYHNQFQD